MPTNSSQLRKAAILVRSLDGDSAAAVLARLSPAEAKRVRLAVQSLGEIDEDERADVSAEFRRSGAIATDTPKHAVELELSTGVTFEPDVASRVQPARPFEFLENARVEALVPYLSREQAQTVAVVLSYLAPARAAQVLAALPDKLQAATIERLSLLGETDPSALQVLERELADWLARQQASRTRPTQRTDTVSSILAAADPSSHRQILANLLKHNEELAHQLAPPARPNLTPIPRIAEQTADYESRVADLKATMTMPAQSTGHGQSAEVPGLHFEDLNRFDAAGLAAILKTIDSDVLALALVGASDELVHRLTSPMPAKVAKAFRQRLHRCGPTRLRDVEAAQREVARVASQFVHNRRSQRRLVGGWD